MYRESEREKGVIHGEFYCFRKMSHPITVHNQLGVADTVAGNTTSSLYLTFLLFHSLICHLPSPRANADTNTKEEKNLKERAP